MSTFRNPKSEIRNPKWTVGIIVFFTALPGLNAATETQLLLDSLPQSALQSAFQILRRDYIRHDELTYEELNRAALLGLLERLRFGAELVPAATQAVAAAAHVHAEFLAPDIAYLRPATFAEGEAALFEKELGKFVEQKARQLILDLRGTRTSGSIEEAALMLQCFIPAGEKMFSMKHIGREDVEMFISKKDLPWKNPMVVLIDAETSNAAESMAACLRQRRLALLMGTKSRGSTVRYAEVKLDDKTTLRYASSEIVLPDGTTVFQRGLTPDFSVQAVLADKWKAFDGSRGKTMKPFITDFVRPRFNETALMTEQNPELDAYVRRTQGQPLPGDEGQVRDVVTQHALDLLRSADFAAQSKINWNGKPNGLPPLPANSPKAIPAKP
jgi:hypothetical protein